MIKSTETGKTGIKGIGEYNRDSSPYGVRDMAGSMAEWCSGYYNEEAGQIAVRGGSWKSDEIGCIVPNRSGVMGMKAYDFLGFRLVKDLPDARIKMPKKSGGNPKSSGKAGSSTPPGGAGGSK